MSTNVFNYINQRLDADKLREVLRFNSYNFGGIIAKESPFTFDGYTATMRASESSPVLMMGGGLLLAQTSDMYIDMTINNTLSYIEVVLNRKQQSLIVHSDKCYLQCVRPFH